MWCVLMSAIYLHKDMYVSIIDAFCSMLQNEAAFKGVKFAHLYSNSKLSKLGQNMTETHLHKCISSGFDDIYLVGEMEPQLGC